MFRYPEISFQNIPRAEEETDPYVAPSRPLYEIADASPLPHPGDKYRPGFLFAFSNDESAPYYIQTQARRGTKEFQEATNRVALLIGEGALLPALQFIPEETVIIGDCNPEMIEFMGKYLAALHTAEHVEDWHTAITNYLLSVDNRTLFDRQSTNMQVAQWRAQGVQHPLISQEAYQVAREAAQKKAIIPWQLDLTDKSDLRYLGDTLRSVQANITFLNLTNVITYGVNFNSARECARLLSKTLPITPAAPILTTSIRKSAKPIRRVPEYQDYQVLGATGPFFGLANLAENGSGYSK